MTTADLLSISELRKMEGQDPHTSFNFSFTSIAQVFLRQSDLIDWSIGMRLHVFTGQSSGCVFI